MYIKCNEFKFDLKLIYVTCDLFFKVNIDSSIKTG